MTIAVWEQQRGPARGLELLRLVDEAGGGYRADGHVVAGDEEGPWALRYTVLVDERWRTRHVDLSGLGPGGPVQRTLDGDGAGNWLVDGREAADLAGCLDVDLAASLFTNTLPIRRLDLVVSESGEPSAVWVGMADLRVEPLHQRYTRVGPTRYWYEVPDTDFAVGLTVDTQGLILSYPDLGARLS
jgi:hypothetical protein